MIIFFYELQLLRAIVNTKGLSSSWKVRTIQSLPIHILARLVVDGVLDKWVRMVCKILKESTYKMLHLLLYCKEICFLMNHGSQQKPRRI